METWKDIKNFEGIYQISDYGQVRSLDRNEELYNPRANKVVMRFRSGRMLKQKTDRYGYQCVHLRGNGEEKHVTVHRLVAEHFVPGNTEGLVVNHKDCNKQNNRSVNLEWCTISQNTKHAYDNGLLKNPPPEAKKGSDHYNFYIDDSIVNKAVLLRKEGSTLTEISKILGISVSSACRITK